MALSLDACLRQATPADLEVLLTLVQEYYTYDQIDFEESRQRTALTGLLQEPSLGQIWLLEQGQPFGYAVLTFGYAIESGGRDAILDELYLREAYRGQGLGSQVLAFIESFCRQAGLTGLYLVVERKNLRAQSVYRKLNYVESDRLIFGKFLD
ncbi:GNAT family N-acetyltransferase [Pseudanabaena sp. FACHB-2040]|uniref:GNAT family N-acetyltransferase n=1 Tax=Pseudanabaena sp. FACHB-2040 TaxID=2692859 RepID=UPI0016894F7C|nr:GNAT family N-acetyltransferase [Pseudanabaena sp. FACHB-2040]MBD2257774.1 GNAT family N-acetyltransferase [Pseudanabaena sp. FACHB-2040]